MTEFILALLFLVIVVEAVTEIIVSSSIFSGFRDYVGQRSSFFGELIHCGYCTSVWVSAAVAWLLPLSLGPAQWANYLVSVFVLHRLSNLFHELTCKWMNRSPLSLAIHKTEAVVFPGDNNETVEE